jgi:hypothetical protein
MIELISDLNREFSAPREEVWEKEAIEEEDEDLEDDI